MISSVSRCRLRCVYADAATGLEQVPHPNGCETVGDDRRCDLGEPLRRRLRLQDLEKRVQKAAEQSGLAVPRVLYRRLYDLVEREFGERVVR